MMRRVFALLLVLVFAISLLAGCGATKQNEAAEDRGYTAETTAGNVNVKYSSGNDSAAQASGGTEEKRKSPALASTGGSGSGITAYNAILADRKVIFNANITLEVENFNESYGKIQSMILANGFVQNSKITRDRYYDKDGNEKFITSGVIVIRVAREKFDSIFGSVKALGEVLDENTYTDDVTDKYFDTESRLKILRLEEERLLAYLEKIDDPETIFKYERHLTEVRQEIESLTGTIRKWDDLVQLSTITINMREKRTDEEGTVLLEEKGYWERLADKFVKSVKGAVNFLGEFIIFLAQALPVLILLGVLAAVVFIMFRFLRKVLVNKRRETRNSVPVTGNEENKKQ